MIIFIYVVVMFSSFLIAYFVKDISTIVNYKLILNSMPFLLSRIVCFSLHFILRPWYLLFWEICKSKKAWEIFLYFFRCFQPLCYWIHLLWNWYTFPYQFLNLLDISANVTLIQIKQKAGHSVSDIKTIIHQ